jgi:hypothetical protein
LQKAYYKIIDLNSLYEDKKMRWWTMLFLPLLFLTALNAAPPERESVRYTVLESSDVSALDYKKPWLESLSDSESYKLYYTRLHGQEVPKPHAPSVNFTRNRVLFISFGTQKTAGYSIELLDVYIRNDILVVKADLLSPFKDEFQAQMVTHPYMLILVPKAGYKRVELRTSKGQMLASALF